MSGNPADRLDIPHTSSTLRSRSSTLVSASVSASSRKLEGGRSERNAEDTLTQRQAPSPRSKRRFRIRYVHDRRRHSGDRNWPGAGAGGLGVAGGTSGIGRRQAALRVRSTHPDFTRRI